MLGEYGPACDTLLTSLGDSMAPDEDEDDDEDEDEDEDCLLYTSPSPRDATLSRMPSSA